MISWAELFGKKSAPELIHEMSPQEREEAFRTECVAPVISDGILDDEEKNLLDALKVLYDVPDMGMPKPEWMYHVLVSTQGRHKTELDAELDATIEKRLFESKRIALPDKHYRRILEWKSYRNKKGEGSIRKIPGTSSQDGTEGHSGDRTKVPEYDDLYGNRLDLQLQQLEATAETEDAQPLAGEQSPLVSGSSEKIVLPEPDRIQIDEKALRRRVEALLDLGPKKIDEIVENIAGDNLGQSESACFSPAFRPNIFSREAEKTLKVVVVEELDADEIWFAGDVHADLLGFEAIVQTFESKAGQNAKLVFLGDLIDRGIHDVEVVTSLWQYMYEKPERYGWVVGNHDEGLQWNTADEMFWSSVNPATFQDWLNQRIDDKAVVAFGTTFVELVRRLPRALFLPGLLAAHGGFPHRDTWSDIDSFSDLESPKCLGDFVWNRWTHSKLKRPNRSSSASTFGAEDFQGFRDVCSKRLEFPIEGMVRGHDHVNTQSERWERREEVKRASYEGRILTINTMSHNQRGDWLGDYTPPNPRAPALARWSPGELLPTPVVVDLSVELVNWYAPECPNCHHPNSPGAKRCELEQCHTSLD